MLLLLMLHGLGGTERLRAELRLSEVLFTNVSGPEDSDGEMSPWVEIINTDNSPIGIENFSLTDDPNDLTKWRIPRKTVAGNGRSLVYLSGKGGMTLLGNEVHSDFKFTGQDDYLALVRPDGV